MEFQPEFEAVGQAGTGEEAIVQAKKLRPDIILMDINMPGMDGISATERISVEVPESAIIIMSVQGEQEYIRKAMVAGAKNYLIKPFTGDELVNAVKQAYTREQKLRSVMAPRVESVSRQPGKIISVFSSKGGVGKTTIATNLAVAFADRFKLKVGVLDAHLQFGDVALFLNLVPRVTIADVRTDSDHLDERTLMSYMTTFNERMHVMAAPLRPEQADAVTTGQITAVLKQMRSVFDVIVVDTAPTFSDTTLAVLDISDIILVVAALDLPTVKNIKLGLEIMQSLGYSDEKVRLLLNRSNSEGGIDPREVEGSFKQTFLADIPSEGKTVVSAVNKGIPFVIGQPEAPVSQKIVALAQKLLPSGISPVEEPTKPKRFKLFG
jgi:pilus assembly protein CpaE